MKNCDDMIIRNLQLVPYMINKMGLRKRQEDFIDIGWIALVKGARKYNPDRGYAESTWLCKYIKYYFCRRLTYENRHCRNTSEIEIVSLDSQVADDCFLYDAIPSDFNVESEFMVTYIITEIENVLIYDMSKNKKVLDHSEVIRDSYGIGREKLTTGQMSDKYNVSRVTINAIQRKFKEKLKKRLEFILD